MVSFEFKVSGLTLAKFGKLCQKKIEQIGAVMHSGLKLLCGDIYFPPQDTTIFFVRYMYIIHIDALQMFRNIFQEMERIDKKARSQS